MQYPEIELIIEEETTKSIIQKLKASETDVGLLVTPLDEKSMVTIPLFYEEFFVQNYYSNLSAIECFANAAKYCTDKNLGAKISYLGAMAERNKFWAQYYKNQPNDYEKQDVYHKDQMVVFDGQYRTFFQLLKDKYTGDDYEKMIINECEGYRDYLK